MWHFYLAITNKESGILYIESLAFWYNNTRYILYMNYFIMMFMHLGFIKLLLILLPFVPSLYGVDVLEWKVDSRELENMERYSYTEVQQTESNKLVYRNRTVENRIDWNLSNNKMEEKSDLSIEGNCRT